MADPISICNRALLGVGARAQISSISPSDGSAASDACAILFAPTFESLARTAYWACLRRQLTLSLLAAAQGTPENPNGTTLPLPPSAYLYQYAYPSDCIAARFIQPSFPAVASGAVPPTGASNPAQIWLPTGGQIPFTVAYDEDPSRNPIETILTNQSQAQLVYTKNQPNPVVWDSLFQEAMVSSLGAFLVPALSLDMPLLQLAISRAEALIARARAADANEGVTVMDHVPDFFRARAGARGWSGWWAGAGLTTYFGQYADMAWPAYGG